MRVTRTSYEVAQAAAKAYPDSADRDYALQYIAWLITAKTLRRPVYRGWGNAADIEAAIDAVLTV